MDKKFYLSKTFWTAIIALAIGVLEYVQGQFVAGASVSVLSIVMIILRFLTTNPISF